MKKILWILIIFVIIFIIYYIINSSDDVDSIREKVNKKYTKSKKLYISPQNIIKDTPIEHLTDKLTDKLNKKLQKISEKFDNKPTYKYKIKLFFAEWCPHCVDFKPSWYFLKNKYSNQIQFVEMDCTNTNPNLTYITGYPTIILSDINDNYIETYNKDRTVNDLESYIKTKLL